MAARDRSSGPPTAVLLGAVALVGGIALAHFLHERAQPPQPTTAVKAPPPSPPREGPRGSTLHQHELVSFAADREGRLLATGSRAEPDERSPVIGVVLWDLRDGRPLRAIPVEGGVPLEDLFQRGLQFSRSGKRLGCNFFGNAVGVVDVASGEVVRKLRPGAGPEAPFFALADDDARVVVGGDLGNLDCGHAYGAIAPLRAGAAGATTCLGRGAPEGQVFRPLVFRGRTVYGASEQTLIALDADSGARLRELPLLPDSPGRVGSYSFAPSPSGRWLAVSSHDPGSVDEPAAVGTALWDLDAGTRVFAGRTPAWVSGFVFDRDERRWAAVEAGRVAGGHQVTLFEGTRRSGAVDGPFEEADSHRFGDGLPFALSPDGKQGLVLRPSGRLERWTIDPRPARAPALLPRVDGAQGLAWPAADTAVAVGPRMLVFLRMPAGEVLARYQFPE